MFFKLLKDALKIKQVRSKILFTLFIILVFRIGTTITVPGINAKALNSLSDLPFLNMLSLVSGNAMRNFSVFALGVSPYITASIVVQLLQMDLLPKFVEWGKQGEVGRRKLNTATRYLTIVIGFFQAFAISFGFNAYANYGLINNPGISTYLLIALVLTAGTMFVTWLGDMITVNGISNGVSIIIFAGIVARMPHDIYEFYVNQLQGKADEELYRAYGFTAALAVAIILVVMLVVYIEQAQRRLPISYSKRPTGANEASWLPLKINSAGVIPVIFASSFIALPQTVLSAVHGQYSEESWYQVATNIFDYQKPAGASLYIFLIVVFTYFYAFVQVNPEKVAENLQKQGGYILSVRPGKDTEHYISGMLLRLSTVGALYLGGISLLPMIAAALWNLPRGLMLGGTNLLIVVGVALEISRQIEGRAIKRKYKGFIQE